MKLLPTHYQYQSPTHNKHRMRNTHDRQPTFVLTSGNKVMMTGCEKRTTYKIVK